MEGPSGRRLAGSAASASRSRTGGPASSWTPATWAFGERVSELLGDPHHAERIGEAAQTRVRDLFLGPRHLGQYVELLEVVLLRLRELTAPALGPPA